MHKKYIQNLKLPESDRNIASGQQYYSPQEFPQYWRQKKQEDNASLQIRNSIGGNNNSKLFGRNQVMTPQASQQRSQHFSYLEKESKGSERMKERELSARSGENRIGIGENNQKLQSQQAYQISQDVPMQAKEQRYDIPKPIKYICHGKLPKKINEHFKDTSLGLQQIVEGFPDYFDHLRGECACGKCICGNCKCEISRLPQQMPNLNPSHYQQNYGPKSNKYSNDQLNRNIANPPGQNIHQNPIDYQTTTKTSYLYPEQNNLELIKKKSPLPEDQELIGSTNYYQNYKDWGNNKQGLIRPCNATGVLNKVPFAGMSNYDENYNKLHNLEQDPSIARIIQKCKIPMFKSPINPSDFPFIGQTTSQRNFHPFAPDVDKFYKMKQQPTSVFFTKYLIYLQLPSTLWKTTHARDYGNKGELECPGRAYVKIRKHY